MIKKLMVLKTHIFYLDGLTLFIKCFFVIFLHHNINDKTVYIYITHYTI